MKLSPDGRQIICNASYEQDVLDSVAGFRDSEGVFGVSGDSAKVEQILRQIEPRIRLYEELGWQYFADEALSKDLLARAGSLSIIAGDIIMLSGYQKPEYETKEVA